MALPNSLKLFIDPKSNTAYPSFDSGTSIAQPAFYFGDTTQVEIYLVESINSVRSFIDFPASPTIKVAVGEIDTAPSAGTFTLTFGANTTSALSYSITAADMQTALNALASVTSAGGVTVSLIGNNYAIKFNTNGARTDITSDGSGLIPLSSSQVTILQQGTSVLPEIALVHLQVLVAGYTNTFTAGDSPAGTVSTISSWANNRVNYKLKLTNCLRGTFTLTYQRTGSNATVTTPAISYNATAQEVSTSLDSVDYSNGTDGTNNGLRHSVVKNADGSYDISFYNIGIPDSGYSNQPGTNGLTVSVTGIGSNPGYVGSLALNTSSAISLLGGSTAKSTSFAVSITATGKTQTILQIPCVLYGVVIDDGTIQPLVVDSYLTVANAASTYQPIGTFTFSDASVQTTAAYSKSYSDSNYVSSGTLSSQLANKLNLSGGTMTGKLYFTELEQTSWLGSGPDIDGVIRLSDGGTMNNFNGLIISMVGNGDDISDNTCIVASNLITVPSVKTVNLLFNDNTTQTTAFIGSNYLAKSGNLSGLASLSTSRTNLGLGTMAVETASNYLTKADNLSGLASASTSRTNLGLGTASLLASTAVLQSANNLTDLASASTARTNLGLGTLALYADAPSDGGYYLRRNNSWYKATIYTTGGKDYVVL